MDDPPSARAMPPSSKIDSRFHLVGNVSRAADVARVLVKYGLAGWLSDIDWPPIHNALKSGRGGAGSSRSTPGPAGDWRPGDDLHQARADAEHPS